MTALLTSGEARPAGIIATTFTKRAAAELRERVRVKLLQEGMTAEANELSGALIGTVHGLGVKLLRRFAFEAGVSPRVDIIAEGDDQRLFNLSMAAVLPLDDIQEIELLCEKLGLSIDGEKYNWRRDVRGLVEVIRANNFGPEAITHSRDRSWTSLAEYLPEPNERYTLDYLHANLTRVLNATVRVLSDPDHPDQTKKTQSATAGLRKLRGALERRGFLPWYEYANLGKYAEKVGARSREQVAELVELGHKHAASPAFHADLRRYQDLLFGTAERAIAEYDRYKKSRGRIDYTDMEVLVLRLLDNAAVRQTLARELDLLMVDEFQDTSPIQLAIFLQLSRLARRSVWVGDPKQSIYGFRGAEPRLMRAVTEASGPVRPENIQRRSWRSREDIVRACNGLFVAAFPEIDPAAVVLDPVRRRAGNPEFGQPAESAELSERNGLVHWHFTLDGKARYSREWLQDVTAKALRELLDNPPPVLPKGARQERPLRPGDVAILCRSNRGCAAVAEALAKQGLAAAISRTGLLQTAEATLLLATLKYLLNAADSLSVAEILLLGSREKLGDIVDRRLDFLADEAGDRPPWGSEDELVRSLDELRAQTLEHSPNELLNLLLERLDLRRRVAAWGDGEQRLDNLDELRRLAVAYEDACHRQHRAASLGGYLLYLDELLRTNADRQGAGERAGAVNVMTYHRSKGLEWPAVICCDLDQPLRAGVWGRDIVPDTESVDLADPLAGRWLRYWVNPYARITRGIPWVEALNESQWAEAARLRARAEEARLLYVGFTRARDFLILPTGKNGAPWVDRAFARGGHETTVFPPDDTATALDHDGHEVDQYVRQWREPRTLPTSPLRHEPVDFLTDDRPGRRAYGARGPDEDWLLAHFSGFRGPAPSAYFSTPEPDPATDHRLLSQAVGAFLHGNWSATAAHPDEALLAERLDDTLRVFQPGGEVDQPPILAQLLAFADRLRQQWPAASVRQRVPFRERLHGREVHGRLDWLLDDPDRGLVVINDVHLPPRQLERGRNLALATATLAAKAAAATQLTGRPLAAAVLHLPGSAGWYVLTP